MYKIIRSRTSRVSSKKNGKTSAGTTLNCFTKTPETFNKMPHITHTEHHPRTQKLAQIHHVNISSSPQVLPFYKRNLLPQHSSSGRMNGLHISRSLSNCSLLTTHLLESKKPLYPYAASLSLCVLISHSYLFHLPP